MRCCGGPATRAESTNASGKGGRRVAASEANRDTAQHPTKRVHPSTSWAAKSRTPGAAPRAPKFRERVRLCCPGYCQDTSSITICGSGERGVKW